MRNTRIKKNGIGVGGKRWYKRNRSYRVRVAGLSDKKTTENLGEIERNYKKKIEKKRENILPKTRKTAKNHRIMKGSKID